MSRKGSEKSGRGSGEGKTNGQTTDSLLEVFAGKLSNTPRVPNTLVKVYVCSNKTDFELERQRIWNECLPELQNYFLPFGVEVQFIDVHQGSDVDHVYDRKAFDRHLEEIRECYDKGIGPFFVGLVGNKYGPVPLPSFIEEVEFQHIRNEAFEAGKDVKLLDKWYIKDSNHIPPAYFLQPVSSDFEYFDDRSSENASRRAADVSSWQGVFQRLQELLQHAASVCYREGKINQVHEYKQNKYYQSGMVQQIYHALDLSPKRCLLFSRGMEGMSPDAAVTKNFTDMKRAKKSIDKSAQEKLTNFKNDAFMKLNTKNQYSFSIRWHENGLSPGDSPEHAEYLEMFQNSFSYNIKSHVERFLPGALGNEIVKSPSEVTRYVYSEVWTHLVRCKQLSQHAAQVFPELEMRLKQLLTTANREPVLIYGPEGCGKSTLVSRLCEAAAASDGTVVVPRFIGLTPASRTPWDVLYTICWQLGYLLGEQTNINHLPFPELVTHFYKVLKTFSSGATRLVIALDGVDNFKQSLSNLDWLSGRLPMEVHIFVTCSTTQSAIEVYDYLKGKLGTSGNILSIPSPDESVAKQIIGMGLADQKRTLGKQQEIVLTDTLKEQSRLLLLRLIESTCSTWTSNTQVSKGGLPKSVQEAINARFKLLEKRVGEELAGHVSRYISASNFGVTEMELLDVVSCNNDALIHALPPDMFTMLRFPHWYWLVIKEYLGPLLEERWVNGKIVYDWSHSCVSHVATHRYRARVEDIRQSHRDLANLFLDTWVGNKPLVVPERGLQIIDTGCRYICQQPLLYSDIRYNVRRTSELWYQLLQSGDRANLKDHALCNFEYLLASLHSTNVHHLLHMFEATFTQALDAELVLVHRCISAGSNILAQDPLQLAGELIGRLRIVKDKFSSTIESLVQQCMEWCDSFTLPLLVPLSPWLSDPRDSLVCSVPIAGGVVKLVSTKSGQHVLCSNTKNEINMYNVPSKKLVKTFKGHKSRITCLLMSSNEAFVLSGSADHTIRLWDISSETSSVFKVHNGEITALAKSKDDDLMVTASLDKTIKVLSLPSGDVMRMSPEQEAPVVALALNSSGSMLVSAAGKKICYWCVEDMSLINTLDEDIPGRVTSLALSADNIFLLLGYDDNSLHVRSFTTGSEIHQLSGYRGKIECIAVSSDSFYCIVGSNDSNAYLFNLRTTELLETLKLGGTVTSVTFNHDEHFIYTADQMTVKVWTFFKQSTQKLPTVYHEDEVTTVVISADGKSAVTGSRDKLVKMWNLEISDFTENLQGHEEAITCVALARDDAFAVSGSVDTTVKVWSIMMGCVITDYKEHTSAIVSVHVLGDCPKVMSAEARGIIKVWMAENGTTILSLDGPVDLLYTSPNGQLGVSGDHNDVSLNIWDVDTGTLIQGICHKDMITCVSFSQDSQYMVTGSLDKSLKVWEAATGKLTQVMVEHGDVVSCVTITDNNKHVISGSYDNILYVWGLSTGATEQQLTGHTDRVNCVRVTKDGSTIISGARDGTLRVWNFTHGTLVTAFDMHSPVLDVMITPVASRLIVRLEKSSHVPLLCLHNSPAAEVKSQSQISIQVNGDTPLLPLRPKPLKTHPYSTYFQHKKQRSDRGRPSVSSIPDIIKVSPMKKPLQKAVKAQEHNRETRSMSMLGKKESKRSKRKKDESKDAKSGICLIL